MLYTDQKDWTNCIHHAQIADRLDPSNKEVQLALGDAYMGLDDPRSALEHLVKATQIDKDFAKAYETMSCSYADLGMHELGAAAAQEALRVNPNSWMALANIGYTESMRGKYVEAVEHQHEALRCHPDQ